MYCNHCGKEIADGSMFCPECGKPIAAETATATPIQTAPQAAQPPIGQQQVRKKKKWPVVLGVIALIIVVLCIIGSLGGNKNKVTPANASDKQTTSQPATEKTDVVKPGSSISTDKVKITFTNCDVNSKDYNEYAEVKKGYKIVKASFSFENISKSDAYISSFKCYADGTSCEDFFGGNNYKNPCLETISAGRKTTGVLYFEVPANAKSIEIEYTDDAWTSSHIVFKAK